MATVVDLITKIEKRLGTTVTCSIINEQLLVDVAASDLLRVAKFLRDGDELKFAQLIDLCGVDFLHYGLSDWANDSATSEGFSRGIGSGQYIAEDCPEFPARFAVVYQLLSIKYNQRLRLRCFAPGEIPCVPSVIDIWPAANWYEREAFDLYGILFDNHPDLRRLLTDYGFVGHPFRKDFPLIGEVEMRFDATQERVVYEPVSIKPRTLVPKVIKHVGHND